MITKNLKFYCPEHYSLKHLCLTHGWRQLRPFAWDGEREELGYVLHIGNQSVDLKIRQKGAVIEAEVTSVAPLDEDETGAVEKALVTMLALDGETHGMMALAEQCSPAYVELVKAGAGRILIAPTAWENAVKTLFTTNCSWTLTRKMAEKICSAPFSEPSPTGAFPFPTPSRVNRFSIDELKSLIPVGYRAGYLKVLAGHFVENPGLETSLLDGNLCFSEAKRKISAFKGFGEYARIHLMTLMGFYGEIPVDSVVRSYMKIIHGVEDVAPFLEKQYGDWGDYRWWKFKMESMINSRNFP